MSRPDTGKKFSFEDELVNQIEQKLTAFSLMLSTEDTLQINFESMFDPIQELSNKLSDESAIKSLLDKCFLISKYCFLLCAREKIQLVSCINLIEKNISESERQAQHKNRKQKQNRANRQLLQQIVCRLKQSPISKLIFMDEKVAEVKPGNRNIIKTHSRQQVEQQLERVKKENSELIEKVKEYQKKTISIQKKLSQLLTMSRVEQFRHNKKQKLFNRIFDHIQNEKYIMRSNYDIRNQCQALFHQNEELRIQLSRLEEAKQNMYNMFQIEKTCLINRIQQLQSQFSDRSYSRVLRTSRMTKPRSSQVMHPEDWICTIEGLQEKIQDLKVERKYDEKLINNLQQKIQKLQQSKSQASISNKLGNFKKQKLLRENLVTPKHSLHTAYRSQDFDEAYQHDGIVNSSLKGYTAQNALKYSKSTRTLRQQCIRPQISNEGFGVGYKKNAASQARLNGLVHDPERENELKTSGYFVDPEKNGQISHNPYKNYGRKEIKRYEGKTLSTIT